MGIEIAAFQAGEQVGWKEQIYFSGTFVDGNIQRDKGDPAYVIDSVIRSKACFSAGNCKGHVRDDGAFADFAGIRVQT